MIGIIIIYFLNIVTITEATPPLIRLHILANSNSQEDQRIKYRVRDHIVSTMSEKFKDSTSMEESKDILLTSLDQLEDEARIILSEEGSKDEVKAYYGIFDFPTKYYGEFSLAAGSYEAVELVIGKGQGANWWCVLFPPLCFVDGESKEVVEAAVKENEKKVELKPALAIVKIWNKIIEGLRTLG
ncbi:MAG: stage II sporulation protein R [Firmicutes bacterium HGW-Firmicutes-12]|nr:MAG: stage II sporulation protein R [Firmicutes bacterium HGW-Firmicutes-12]